MAPENAATICPIHKLPDCSPLLNACTWLTDPQRHIEAHETAELSIDWLAGFGPRMKVIRCTADGCIWGAETGKSRAKINEAFRQHLLAVATWCRP